MMAISFPFIPAKAGIQRDKRGLVLFGPWVPAFAGTNGDSGNGIS
jgi:hypothetical protein